MYEKIKITENLLQVLFRTGKKKKLKLDSVQYLILNIQSLHYFV